MAETIHYFRDSDTHSMQEFEHTLSDVLERAVKPDQKIVILCIGTDNVIGDSLGPLVGYGLESKSRKFDVFGTLENPIALPNIEKALNTVKAQYTDPFIIVVDASIGSITDRPGDIIIHEDGIYPGKSFKNDFGKVGDIAIIGIVRSGNTTFERFIREVRINTIVKMAVTITGCLTSVLHNR